MTNYNRRTLKFISEYPSPEQMYERITTNEGWQYKSFRKDYYVARDRALVSCLYLLAIRISEALRLKKSQFFYEGKRLRVKGIELSKVWYRSKGMTEPKARKDLYREEAYIQFLDLPISKKYQELIEAHLEELEDDERLFSFGRVRAFQITTALLGIPNHWLRAYGEDFLLGLMNGDITALSQYIKVDVRTLMRYVRHRWKRVLK